MARRPLLLLALLTASCASSASLDETFPAPATRSPEQLAAFVRTHEAQLAAGDRAALSRLDALCSQHDCRSSRLFWFTDLEQAKARAQREGKPILSLRMLGKLTDAQSCANSRFFRSVLYPDPQIASLLRERFVLHWREVRPVPTLTIDFGDGRTMQRTLTGNSMHLVLDSSGRPLDALPGMLTPTTFRDVLRADVELHDRLASSGARRDALLAGEHQARLRALVASWHRLLRARGGAAPRLPGQPQDALHALDIASRAVGYARLATEAQLAPAVEERIAARFPDAWRANEVAVTKAILESPILAGLRRVRTTLGVDSIENELWNHGRVHVWFMRGEVTDDPVALDHRVYAELFLSPLDDPWYGLMPPEEMRALDDCATVVTAS